MIYGVCVEIQEDLINRHCFGDCGKIRMAAILESGLSFLPCTEDTCPYEVDKTEVLGQVDDEDFCARKIGERKEGE